MSPGPAVDGSLEAFFERLRSINPFLDNRVTGPAAAECDAAAIHPHAFTRLTDLAVQALAARRGLGVVVWGEAGIGKSHLLARLGRWAATDHHAVFVYLHNLQAAPEHLPRALLRHVVAVLTRGRRRNYHATPLFELTHAGAAEAVGDAPRPPSWGVVRKRFNALVDRLAHDDHPGAAGFERSIYDVLFRFFHSAYCARMHQDDGAADLAARWLAGQALDAHEAQTLGLPPPRRRDDSVALEDTQQIKQVLVALSRLAASNEQPFILAFDQVDNLDTNQFVALARFLEALLDSAPNLLVVTSGVRASLERWHDNLVVQHSAWDRLAQFEILLQRLNVEQAAQLIHARLHSYLLPFAGLEAIQRRRREDAFFPLGNDWFQRQFHDRHDVRPRDVINWAREGWREQQEAMQGLGDFAWLARTPSLAAPSPPPPLVELTQAERRDLTDRLVEQRVAELAAQPVTSANLPADAEHLACLLIAVLSHCREDARFGIAKVESVLQVNGRPPRHTLNIAQQFSQEAPITTGVLVLTTTKATTATATLRRVARQPPSVKRFILLTEERIGLPLASMGKSYFDKVEHRFAPHFHHLRLTTREYAYWQALETVIREARAGDLEIPRRSGEGLPVNEAEVIASHHRRDRYRAARVLIELLAPILQPGAPAAVAP
jgi:hypothetical protein